MQTALFPNLKQRWRIEPRNLRSDFLAGLTLGIESIPDSLASAVLAGVNPVVGLYTMMVATPIGALFTSSEMMSICTTSAISLAVGSSLTGLSSANKVEAVFMLAFLVGIIQIALGLFKLGSLVRFVPFSVMTGFLNGVAVLIILGQFEDLTGYKSLFSNKVFKMLDTFVHLDWRWSKKP